MSEPSTNRRLKKSGLSDRIFRKRFPLQDQLDEKQVDIEEGTFEGFSAGIGNLDRGNDRIMPGAFRKTIQERVPSGQVKLLNGHQSRDTQDLWGKVVDAEERNLSASEREELAEKLDVDTEATPTHRLWSRFQVGHREPARNALKDVAEGILDGLSIGFRTVQIEFVKDDEADEDIDAEIAFLRGQGERRIHELAWWETSLVVWGMNQAALTIPDSVKSTVERVNDLNESDSLDEKDIRYAIRSLKGMIEDCDATEARRWALADQSAQKQADPSIKADIEDAEAPGEAKEEFLSLFDDFLDQASEAAPSPEAVSVLKQTRQEIGSSGLENKVREASEIDFEGAETEEEQSWGGVDKDFEAAVDGYYKHNPDAERPDEGIDTVDEAPQTLLNWTAARTIDGAADADDVDGLISYPVVNFNTNQLNEGGVSAADSFAGQQGDDEVQRVANNLMEEHFSDDEEESDADTSDVEEKTMEISESQLDEVVSSLEGAAKTLKSVSESDSEEEKSSEDDDTDDIPDCPHTCLECHKHVGQDTDYCADHRPSEDDGGDDSRQSAAESEDEPPTPEQEKEVAGDTDSKEDADGPSDEHFEEEEGEGLDTRLAELEHLKRKHLN